MARSKVSGPFAGAYCTFSFTSDVTTGSAELAAPFACKIMAISAHATSGTSPTYQVTVGGSDVVASRTAPTTPETMETTNLVAAYRDVAKGTIIAVIFGGTSPQVQVHITVRVKDHVNTRDNRAYD